MIERPSQQDLTIHVQKMGIWAPIWQLDEMLSDDRRKQLAATGKFSR